MRMIAHDVCHIPGAGKGTALNFEVASVQWILAEGRPEVTATTMTSRAAVRSHPGQFG